MSKIHSFGSRVHVSIDFETYSKADLQQVGAYVYSRDISTDVLNCSYRIKGRDEVKRWYPGRNVYPFSHLAEKPVIHAWNAQFEYLIWNHVLVPHYDWPVLSIEDFVCTAAKARWQGVPGKLENAPKFLEIPIKKDMRGHAHMMKMCKPATDIQQGKFLARYADYKDSPDKEWPDFFEEWEWSLIYDFGIHEAAERCHHSPENIEKNAAYCDQDVITEDSVDDRLTPWDEKHLRYFWINERINLEGLPVDKEFAEKATTYAEEEKAWFGNKLSELTNGEITAATQYQRHKTWCLPRMSDEAIEMTKVYKKGKMSYSFGADVRYNLLQENLQFPGFLTEEVKEFLELLDMAGKAATGKYQAVVNQATKKFNDAQVDKVHGLYMIYGALQTGRTSGTKIQTQNLVRKVPPGADYVIEDIIDGDFRKIDDLCAKMAADPFENDNYSFVHLLSQLIRPTFTGEFGRNGDHALVWGDWSAIEARGLPWVSGYPEAESKLDLFRQGKDLYIHTAADILEIDEAEVTKEARQTHGKVPELALGYAGGAGAFAAMAKVYRATYPEDEIPYIVRTWRAKNQWAVDFWDLVEDAAMCAIEHPGKTFEAGKLVYEYSRKAYGYGCLYCILPSGRKLHYHDASIDMIKLPWGEHGPCITAKKASFKPKQGEKDWPRLRAWKGLLVENAVQALCADLLYWCLNLANNMGLKTIGHTHDELIIKSLKPRKDGKLLQNAMNSKPAWAQGFPVSSEVEWGWRYKVKEESLESGKWENARAA